MSETERETCPAPRRRKAGGRASGTPNKVTREFRETVNTLLAEKAGDMGVWLNSVAEGDPAAGRPPDPARALDLWIRLAEFVVPKLTRVEHESPEGAGIQIQAIKVEFVDPDGARLNRSEDALPV